VATQDYLDKNGIPRSPDDLAEHTLIASRAGNMGHDWHFDHQGKKQSIRIHARLNVTTNQAAINAAKQGIGITRVISYQVAQALDQGTLKSVLSNYEQPAMPVHIIHREGRMASNKVRSFIDLMAQKLRLDKRLNAA
ncbi:MAG: LysR family transcriptional regulator, partial [Gammaproteobacteria bacterium]|nr:LysR family transcriptional regulator [Gammaproteobacteria bacterium]